MTILEKPIIIYRCDKEYILKIKTARKELIKINGKKCHYCLLERPINYLEVDHIIPITCGGEQGNINNLQLLCKNCHYEKTLIDKKIINSLKVLGLLKKISKYRHEIYISYEDINNYYKIYYPLIKELMNKGDTL